MKTTKLFFLAYLLALPIMMFSQKLFPTSMNVSFSGGNNGVLAGIGNDCGNADVDLQYNSINGNLEVTVNKVCHSWSFLQHWMGNSFAPSIVFKKRFIELRVQSTAAHTGLNINFAVTGNQYNPNGSIGKSIPAISYNINEADTWEIKFFNVGGTADTVFGEMQYNFPNGFYKYDYWFYGDAAIPPVPTIDQVKDQNCAEGNVRTITLTHLEIPGRLYDGLKIAAEAKSDGFLKDVSILDLGGGTFIDEENKSATLQYTPVKGMSGNADSIIVTLTDTIRNTVKRMAFHVGIYTALEDVKDKISIYPTVTTGVTTIDFPEVTTAELSVIDLVGNVVLTESLRARTKAEVDLSRQAPGIYTIRISDESGVITKKVLKQ